MKYNILQMELLSNIIRLEALQLWKRNHGPLSGTLSIVDVYTGPDPKFLTPILYN